MRNEGCKLPTTAFKLFSNHPAEAADAGKKMFFTTAPASLEVGRKGGDR
jgi:hypothetical protein